MKRIGRYISSLFSIFLPRRCACCGIPLDYGEECICIECLMNIPRINTTREENPIEMALIGNYVLKHATSYFYYSTSSPYAEIIRKLKYGNRPDIGRCLGRMAAQEIGSEFFENIDCIIPIPLHSKKKRLRGYNQSKEIAKGIRDIYNIPIDGSVKRVVNTETQTQKTASERLENMKNVFECPIHRLLDNKHILLVDDVLTTGATITSCIEAINNSNDNVTFSVFTLSWAGGK